jgi:two-component system chemotaxis response regulator CheB
MQVLALGASTGGPAAVVEILRSLPDHFRLPILLVLHINDTFAAAFAEWLCGQSARSVAYAGDGDLVTDYGGRVAMAPPDQHLVVSDGRLRLTDGVARHSCCPSIDTLFESIARDYGNSAAAALLTGMGRDGAAGLLAIRRAGGVTIAQDEATSIVFGMPREAALLGAASHVLPIDGIGPALASLTTQRVGKPA